MDGIVDERCSLFDPTPTAYEAHVWGPASWRMLVVPMRIAYRAVVQLLPDMMTLESCKCDRINDIAWVSQKYGPLAN